MRIHKHTATLILSSLLLMVLALAAAALPASAKPSQAGLPLPQPWLVDYGDLVATASHNAAGLRNCGVFSLPIVPGTWYAFGGSAGTWREDYAWGPNTDVVINLAGNPAWSAAQPYYCSDSGGGDRCQTGVRTLPPNGTVQNWSASSWISLTRLVDPDPPGGNFPPPVPKNSGQPIAQFGQYLFQAPAGATTLYYRWRDTDCSDNDAGGINDPVSYNEDFYVAQLYGLNFDTVPPSSSHTLSGTLGNAGWYISNVTVTITASDPEDLPNYLPAAGVAQITFDGSAYGGPTVISTQGPSSHSYFAQDDAQPTANVETPAHTFQLQIDTGKPTTNVTTPGGPAVGAINLTGTSSDATSGVALVEISLDGGATWLSASGTTAWTYAWDTSGLPDGSYTVLTRASDVAGNVGDPQPGPTFVVDNNRPTVALSTPAPNAARRGAVAVSGTAADPGGSGINRVELSFDGGASWVLASGTTSWSYTWNSASLPDGPASITARAFDNNGNVSDPAARDVTLDNTGPLTQILYPTAGLSVSGPLMLQGSADDGAGVGVGTVQWSVDGGATWQTASGTNTWTATWNTASVPDGLYTLLARSIDGLGNVGPPAQVGDIQVDNTPALVTILDPLDGQYLTATYPVSGIAEDQGGGSGLARVEFSADGSAWQTATGTDQWLYEWDTTSVPDGPRTLYARGADPAGNLSPVDSVQVVVDNTPPTIQFLNPTAGTTVSGTFRFNGVANDGYGSGLARVEVSFDGGQTWHAQQAADPANWYLDFDTTRLPNGSTTVLAHAIDRVGLVGLTAELPITVSNQNQQADDPPPPPPGAADLVIVGKPDVAALDDEILWAVDVTNTGQNGTGSLVVVITIPDELDILEIISVSGGYRLEDHTITVNLDSIPAGQKVHIVVRTKPNARAAPGEVCASAHFEGSTDLKTDCVLLFPAELPKTGGQVAPLYLSSRRQRPR